MKKEIYSNLKSDEISSKIKNFLEYFSEMKIFEKVEIEESGLSTRIKYLLKNRDKLNTVDVSIKKEESGNKIIIKNEDHFVIDYFIFEFGKFL